MCLVFSMSTGVLSVFLHSFAPFLDVSQHKEVTKADPRGIWQMKLTLPYTVIVSDFEIVLSGWFTEVELMWSDGVCCAWASCAHAELFIIVT